MNKATMGIFINILVTIYIHSLGVVLGVEFLGHRLGI